MTKKTDDKLGSNKPSSKLLEDSETKLQTLRQLLIQGEESGVADYRIENLIAELDEKTQKNKIR